MCDHLRLIITTYVSMCDMKYTHVYIKDMNKERKTKTTKDIMNFSKKKQPQKKTKNFSKKKQPHQKT